MAQVRCSRTLTGELLLGNSAPVLFFFFVFAREKLVMKFVADCKLSNAKRRGFVCETLLEEFLLAAACAALFFTSATVVCENSLVPMRGSLSVNKCCETSEAWGAGSNAKVLAFLSATLLRVVSMMSLSLTGRLFLSSAWWPGLPRLPLLFEKSRLRRVFPGESMVSSTRAPCLDTDGGVTTRGTAFFLGETFFFLVVVWTIGNSTNCATFRLAEDLLVMRPPANSDSDGDVATEPDRSLVLARVGKELLLGLDSKITRLAGTLLLAVRGDCLFLLVESNDVGVAFRFLFVVELGVTLIAFGDCFVRGVEGVALLVDALLVHGLSFLVVDVSAASTLNHRFTSVGSINPFKPPFSFCWSGRNLIIRIS